MAFVTLTSNETGADSLIDINNNFAKSTEGAASSTDNAIPRFDSITGKLLQNSSIIISDIGGGRTTINTPSLTGSVGNRLEFNAGASTDMTGGAINVKGGTGGTDSAGGFGNVAGGAGNGSGAGGYGSVTGGVGGATGAGGSAIVQGGAGGATSGNGGAATIYGGDATAGNSSGGDVLIQPGAKSGSGADGQIVLCNANSASVTARLNLDSIASTTKTFTLPNQTGIISTATSGSGAPGSTPAAIGQIYCDTSGGKAYISTGTSSSADWKILN